MTPLKFTIDNCNELLDDARRKLLGGEARKWAEAGYKPRRHWKASKAKTLAECMIYEHERIYWLDCYYKRLARIKRMKDGPVRTR